MGTADHAGGCQRIAGASEAPGKGPSVVLGAPNLASLPLLPRTEILTATHRLGEGVPSTLGC